MLSVNAFADSPQSIKDLTQGPAVPYLEEKDNTEMIKTLQQADGIFTAKIQDIALDQIAFVLRTEISFYEIVILKGEPLKVTSLDYKKSPKDLNFRPGTQVIVALKKSSKSEAGVDIAAIYEATKENLLITQQSLGG